MPNPRRRNSRYPKRTRRPPLRLVVTIDPNDENPSYEEKRIVVTHGMNIGEAEETSDSSPPELDTAVLRISLEDVDVPTAEDLAFVVPDNVENSDSDFLPDEDEELDPLEFEEDEEDEDTQASQDHGRSE